jgi:hypothetical protein
MCKMIWSTTERVKVRASGFYLVPVMNIDCDRALRHRPSVAMDAII